MKLTDRLEDHYGRKLGPQQRTLTLIFGPGKKTRLDRAANFFFAIYGADDITPAQEKLLPWHRKLAGWLGASFYQLDCARAYRREWKHPH